MAYGRHKETQGKEQDTEPMLTLFVSTSSPDGSLAMQEVTRTMQLMSSRTVPPHPLGSSLFLFL